MNSGGGGGGRGGGGLGRGGGRGRGGGGLQKANNTVTVVCKMQSLLCQALHCWTDIAAGLSLPRRRRMRAWLPALGWRRSRPGDRGSTAGEAGDGQQQERHSTSSFSHTACEGQSVGVCLGLGLVHSACLLVGVGMPGKRSNLRLRRG